MRIKKAHSKKSGLFGLGSEYRVLLHQLLAAAQTKHQSALTVTIVLLGTTSDADA